MTPRPMTELTQAPPVKDRRRRADKRPLILLALAAVFITGLGWASDNRSCNRNNALRTAYNKTVHTQTVFLSAARDARMAAVRNAKPGDPSIKANLAAIKAYNGLIAGQTEVKHLGCARVFPETN